MFGGAVATGARLWDSFLQMQDAHTARSTLAAFGSGFLAGYRSIFPYVLFATYIGIGALARELNFSLLWTMLSTFLIWAGPAQLILITALGSGATLIETAIAITLSAVRLLPMVASLLPIMRGPRTRTWEFVLPAHFTAISSWAENIRLLPSVAREQRIAFANGIGAALLGAAIAGTWAGYDLAGNLPSALASALLFLTPLSFVTSTVRNARQLSDRVAFALGIAIGPLLAYAKVGLDLMWTGIIAGTIAYLVHRLRKRAT